MSDGATDRHLQGAHRASCRRPRFRPAPRIEDRPTPDAGAGQLLVRVEASGLCHTDIHAAHGDWPVKPSLPFVPGHEGVGIVAAIGAGVTGLAEGDRVAVPWLGWACGACEWCASGLGDAVPAAAQHRLLGRRRLRRVRRRRGAVRRSGPRRHRPVRRRTAHLRRRHDLQGGEGVGRAIVGPRRRLRHRWARSPRACSTRRSPGRRSLRSTSSTASSSSPSDLGATYTVNAADEDPVEAIQAPRWRRRRHRPRRLPDRVRAGLPSRCDATAPGPRRPARRQRRSPPHLRDGAPGHHRDRFDRGHPRRPRRDLRAPRRRSHHRGPRDRGTRQVNEAIEEVEHGAVDARIVFDLTSP